MDQLRSIADTIQNKEKSCVLILAASYPNRLLYRITVTDDLVAKGYSAKKLADVFTGIVGGRGGGKDNKVEGGGKEPQKIQEGFAAVEGLLRG